MIELQNYVPWFFIISTFVLANCSSAPRSVASKEYTLSGTQQNSKEPLPVIEFPLSVEHVQEITLQGNCYNPSPNAKGTKILYVCQNRKTHTQSEIYELDMPSGFEKRITFQDGNISNPIYTVSEKIIYSSTTDEKIDSFLKALTNLNPLPAVPALPEEKEGSELYMSDREGRTIERLTFREGFDGRVAYTSGPHWQLYYACPSQNKASLCRLNLINKKNEVLDLTPETSKDYVTISPDQKTLAWLQKDLSKLTTYVNLTSLSRPGESLSFELPPGAYKDLSFYSMNEVIFSYITAEDSKEKSPQFKIGMFNFATQQFVTLLEARKFKEKEFKEASLEEASYMKTRHQLLLVAKTSTNGRVVSRIISIEMPQRPQILDTTVAYTPNFLQNQR